MEAKTLTKSIQDILAGHPCEKADTLRAIAKNLPHLPSTEQLDEECQIYLGAMTNRVNATSLEEALRLIETKAIEQFQQQKAGSSDADSVAVTGVSILDGEEDITISTNLDDDLALLESSLLGAKQQRLAQSTPQIPPSEITVGNDSAKKSFHSQPHATELEPPSPSSTKSLASSCTTSSSLFQRIQLHKQQGSV